MNSRKLVLLFMHIYLEPCALNPGIFARGVQAQLPENSSDNVFFSFSPQLILQFDRGVPMVISKKTFFYQGFRGGPTFSWEGGVPTFSRGVQMLICMENHITCDIPRGSGPPAPPSLWIALEGCVTSHNLKMSTLQNYQSSNIQTSVTFLFFIQF